MGLFDSIGVTADSTRFVQFNTGTMFDVITGNYLSGYSGEYILQGGIGVSNGWGGVANSGKTACALGTNVCALERYPGSVLIQLDSETSGDKKRTANFSNLHWGPDREKYIESLMERIRYLHMGDIPSVEALLEKIIYPTMQYIDKHRKDFLRPTPFVDYQGNIIYTLTPTFLVIDSLSELKVEVADALIDKHGISSSETNIVAMKEGQIKARLLRDLSNYALKYGIIITFTAQLQSIPTIGRSPMAAAVKELPAMKGDTKYSNVGNKFKFLISNLFGVTAVKPMTNGNDPEYYLPFNTSTGPSEFSTTTIGLERCKNNASNVKFKPIVSQTYGYQNNLSNLQTLKDHKYYGLLTSGNNSHVKPILYPEVDMTKRNSMEKMIDPKTARAIEIVAQLCISQTFVTNNTAVDFNITPQELADGLAKSTYKVDDILASRGWWTFTDTDLHKSQPYMSLPDIIKLIKQK